MKDEEKKLTKARAGLILDQPFFGALSLRLKMEQKPGYGTVGTDGARLVWDPEYIKDLSLEQVKALWAEEVLHCGLSHHLRRGARDHKKWNMACDQAIFHILRDAGFVLPSDSQVNPAYKGKTAEQVYSLMPEAPPGGGGGWGEVEDGKNDAGQTLQPSELDAAEADWKVAMTQAAQSAKMQGNLPSELARLVDCWVNPKAPWQDLLRQFVEMSAKNDYSWVPPSRRYLAQGFYLPSLRSAELPEIVIAVDTSGSITQGELNTCAAEITGILEAWDTTIHVVYADADLQGSQVFTREDLPLKLDARGGGGTDFRAAFAWIEEQGLEPAAMIYLTDLDCSQYPRDPGFPVLWAKVGTWPSRKPPFGDVVEID
jgi:predicted metal-dependent peptidase